MSSFGDRIIDITPSPLYRAIWWVKERPRRIKWWFQRANGKLPECDCWSYKDTLANSISQGLDYLLRPDGVIDWETDKDHRKMKKDLEFAKDWFIKYKAYEQDRYLIVRQPGESLYPLKNSEYLCVISQEEMEQYEKDRKKAFQILGKYFYGLWD